MFVYQTEPSKFFFCVLFFVSVSVRKFERNTILVRVRVSRERKKKHRERETETFLKRERKKMWNLFLWLSPFYSK